MELGLNGSLVSVEGSSRARIGALAGTFFNLFTGLGGVEIETAYSHISSLDVFDFGLLLQALAHSLKVGTLRVVNGPREKYIYLNRDKVQAIYTPRSRYRIGRILYHMQAVELDDLQEAILEQSGSSGSFGDYLVEKGLVTADELTAGNEDEGVGSATLAYGIGGSDPFIAPMALAMGVGLLFATPITLALVPSLYLISDDIKRVFRWIGRLLFRRPAPGAVHGAGDLR